MSDTDSVTIFREAARPTYQPPGVLRTAWLIARRAAVESLRDRNTAITNVLMVLVVPAVVTFALVVPGAAHMHGPTAGPALGVELAIYQLVVGTFPSSGSVGIAAGVFAGEKEQGNLTPLLASPATNAAIFGGKVVGAILPPLVYAALAEALFLIEIWLAAGQRVLALVSPSVYVLMLAMVPCYAMLGAGIASLISSRVRTFSAAQTYAGLLLLPVYAATFALVIRLLLAPVWALALGVAGVAVLNLGLILIGAATWRREEVLAQR